MSVRCVGLLSGGLDSILATRLLLDMGLDVRCINFRSPFCTCTPKGQSCAAAVLAARQAGDVPLEVQVVGEDYLEVIKRPRFKRGRGMNPCLDCRIFKFRAAWRYARSIDARFLFTGEVLGQRPMSQHRNAMKLIDRHSELEGHVLRPLCAKHLPETIPEQQGWVDRQALLGFQGRTRRPQMDLADRLGIEDYPCPAGGCLLTDRGYARRLRDLFEHSPDADVDAIAVLRVGRHFRMEDGAKVVVARNDGENKTLRALQPTGTLLDLQPVPGPLVLVQGAAATQLARLGGDAAFAFCSAERTRDLELRIEPRGEPPRRIPFQPSGERDAIRESMLPWRL